MAFFHLAILSLVQGITEFLPISSSAHLILVPALTDWPDQGPTIDIAVHMGTLLAVLLYFRRDVAAMAKGAVKLAAGKREDGARLTLHVVAATVPIVVAGVVLVRLDLADSLRSVRLIAWTTLGFGCLLYVADRFGPRVRRMENMVFRDALYIGLAQILALLPGTSRSGITMTAACALGMNRPDGARFSMLLSIPTILAAGTLAALDVYKAGDMGDLGADAALAAVLAFGAALCSISLLMRWLSYAGFGPFVVYRIILGVGLLIWSYA